MTESESLWMRIGKQLDLGVRVLSGILILATAANAWIGSQVSKKVDELSRRVTLSDSLAVVRDARTTERFQVIGDVLELTSTAMVEGNESEEGREALRRLRSLRRVLPRE